MDRVRVVVLEASGENEARLFRTDLLSVDSFQSSEIKNQLGKTLENSNREERC